MVSSLISTKGNLTVGLHIFKRDAAYLTGDGLLSINKAEELDKILQPVHNAMFIESNPSPVKYAASLLGMCNPSVRLPLVEVKDETKKKVSEALKVAKLL